MLRRTFCTVACVIAAFTTAARAADAVPKTRSFSFTYAATISGVPAGREANVWLPLASDRDADQEVTISDRSIPARDVSIGRESKYGNQILFFKATPAADGTIPLRIVYRVKRTEATERPSLADDPPDEAYLAADKLVPVDGKPATLLADKMLPADQELLGRALYDLVDDRMQYRKDQPGWGRGDAVWACDSRFGNCTDFHSLFMSLARSQRIPAKFELGFCIPEKRGSGDVPGYHCWAKFKPQGHGWIPVDISEANKNPAKRDYYFGHLCENRLHFTTGRDLTLVPPQKGEALNFMVFPYVEVDGVPLPAEKIKMSCSYRDLDSPAQAATAPAR